MSAMVSDNFAVTGLAALKFSASVPGELRFRDLVGNMVREVCRRVERDAHVSGLEWRMLSAFNEAFNNIVEHAYADVAGEVEVLLLIEEERVVLRLTDQGEGFNFDLSGARDTPPDFETLSEGGMGLFIIRKAMTEVTYERRHNRNLLTMTKNLSECARNSESPHGETRC